MKIYKVLKTILVIVMMFTIFANISYVVNAGIAEDFGYNQEKDFENQNVKSILNRAISVTKMIAVAVSIIMLIVLGIKYVVASPGEKAEVKKHLSTYVIGAALAFGAYTILEIIQHFAAEEIQ